MQYYSEMCDKYGFNNGESVPLGIEVYRHVYVMAINELARKNNSNVRVVPFDRGGAYNPCMIITVTKESFENHYLENFTAYPKLNGTITENNIKKLKEDYDDEALEDAIEQAEKLNLDDCIEVKSSINQNQFDSIFAKL